MTVLVGILYDAVNRWSKESHQNIQPSVQVPVLLYIYVERRLAFKIKRFICSQTTEWRTWNYHPPHQDLNQLEGMLLPGIFINSRPPWLSF